MFIIREPFLNYVVNVVKGPEHINETRTNSIRDVYDIVLNMTNSTQRASQAMYYASNMNIGDSYDFGDFMMYCVDS